MRMEAKRRSLKKSQKKVIKKRGERYVPEDIARDILLRLPGKSLVRFRSVCKNWNKMISDPDFEEINFRRLISKMMIVCRIPGIIHAKKLLLKLEEGGTRARKVTFLGYEGKYDVCVEKSCNSLVLLRSQPSILYLYDAITHQQKQLPEIPKLENEYWPIDNLRICSSLIFDSSEQKYKVVVFNYDGRSYALIMCFIYSLNLQNWREKEQWRKVKPPRFQNLWLNYFSSIAFDGIFYWVAETVTRPLDPPIAFIQPMNIATGEFMEIIHVPRRPSNCNLLKIKGSLCLTNAASPYELHIWVLKDSIQSVWMNQYKISFWSIVNRPSTLLSVKYCFIPLLVTESYNNRTTYILVSHRWELYWYNMDTEEMKLIVVDSDSLCSPPIAFFH